MLSKKKKKIKALEKWLSEKIIYNAGVIDSPVKPEHTRLGSAVCTSERRHVCTECVDSFVGGYSERYLCPYARCS